MTKRRKFSRWSRRVERNILSVYHRANSQDLIEGMLWYQRANTEAKNLGEKYGVSLQTASGVIAALSPGNPWGKNLLDADTLIEAWAGGARGRDLPLVGTYGWGNVIKAEKILSWIDPLKVLGGMKVRAFYENILAPGESHAVTIDRHAKCLAWNLPSFRNGFASSESNATVRDNEYRYLAWHYERTARRLGLLPSQLQAVCWVTWKRIEGNLESSEVPF